MEWEKKYSIHVEVSHRAIWAFEISLQTNQRGHRARCNVLSAAGRGWWFNQILDGTRKCQESLCYFDGREIWKREMMIIN